jgi:hypothetical protein
MQWPGLWFMAWGLYALGTSLSGPLGHRWNFRASKLENYIGPKATRIVFCVLGAFLVVFGTLVLFGYIQPKG